MYKKITKLSQQKDIKDRSILAMYYGKDEEANSIINRATTEHYEVTRFDESTGKYDLSIPSDEIPDGFIYVDGKPIDGTTSNEPQCYRSVAEMIEDNCWWIFE